MLGVIQQFKTFRPLIFQLSISKNLSFLVGSMLSLANAYFASTYVIHAYAFLQHFG